MINALLLLSACGLLGISVVYIPGFLLRHSDQFTRDDLISAYPELAWIRWALVIGNILWVPGVMLAYVTLGRMLESLEPAEIPGICLFATAFPSIMSFNGFFAVVTNICPVPALGYRWLYAYGDAARRAGLIQICVVVALVTVGVLVTLVSALV